VTGDTAGGVQVDE